MKRKEKAKQLILDLTSKGHDLHSIQMQLNRKKYSDLLSPQEIYTVHQEAKTASIFISRQKPKSYSFVRKVGLLAFLAGCAGLYLGQEYLQGSKAGGVSLLLIIVGAILFLAPSLANKNI